MKKICYLLLPFCLFFLPTTSFAGNFEVTPLLGYTLGGSFDNSENGDSIDVDESANYGLILSFKDPSKPGHQAFYEILYSRQSSYLKIKESPFSSDPQFDLDINYLHFGGRYGTAGGKFNPYVAAGIGVAHFSPEEGDSETKFSFSLGVGATVPITDNLGLRMEGRGFGTLFNSDSSLFCTNNRCLVTIDGSVFWQFSGFAGVVFSF